jgi:hypothetical protein
MAGLFPAFIVVAILLTVMLSELVKRLDRRDRLKGHRICLPLVFSLGAAALLRIGNFFVPEQVWFWWAVIFGFSVFAYEAILKKIAAALEKQDGAVF